VKKQSRVSGGHETLRQMPRSEKLKLMEALWEELSRMDGEFEHGNSRKTLARWRN
jgi:hypothetical protein